MLNLNFFLDFGESLWYWERRVFLKLAVKLLHIFTLNSVIILVHKSREAFLPSRLFEMSDERFEFVDWWQMTSKSIQPNLDQEL